MRPRTDKIIAPERQAELFDLFGTTIDSKYKLERLLGSGGMGGVYAATPVSGGAKVAIKVLSVADPSARERIAKRFAREARAVSALRCPYVVTVLDAGSDAAAARPYLVMELLEGEDLGQRIRRDGRVPAGDALHVAAQILVALGTAHEASIVHRDLKPDNIFLAKSSDGTQITKLLDFGMSKMMPGEGQTLALALTKKGMAVGTPFYMAPEQARARDDVDGRVDLWGLGAILFECLAGRLPFVGPTQEQTLIAICTTDAPDVRALRPEVPSKVAKLIARALMRDRSQRFQSAWQMLAAIVEIAPEEARLLPAKASVLAGTEPLAPSLPKQQVPTPPPDAPSARSGPFSATVGLAPIPLALSADASGPHHPRHISRPTPTPHSPPRSTKPRAVRIVLFSLCALLLGVGVAVYTLAMTRTH